MLSMRAGIVAVALAGAWVALSPAEAEGQRRERDRITREEILASAHRDQDLHRAIRGLRPRFLEPPRGVRSLGGTPPAAVTVFVDGRRQGGPEVLLPMMASTVEEVRYLDPARAESQYGPSVTGGAILVKLYVDPGPAPTPPPAVPPPPGEGKSAR